MPIVEEYKFIISVQDLERIKSLQGHPLFKRSLSDCYSRIEDQVVNGIEPWEGDITSHNRTVNYMNLLDMGLIYLLFGDEKIKKACIRDVMTFIEVAENNQERAMSASKIEQTHINKSLLFIFDWLKDSFSELEQKRVRKMILEAVPRHLHALGRWCIQDKLVQNHYLADAVGVSEVLLYFNDVSDSKCWSDLANEIAIQYMKDAFYADGVQNELSPSYHSFCLQLGITLAQNLRVYGKRDLFKEPWFRDTFFKGLQWLSSLITPDGGVVSFNDCHPTLPPYLFLFGASQFKNSHFQWVGDKIRNGKPRQEKDNPEHCILKLAGDFFYSTLYLDPTVESKKDPKIPAIFSDGGTVCFRNLNSNGEGILAQKCGRYIGGHAHADRLGFDFWHENHQVLIEPGVLNQASLSGLGWYKSSTSHNVLAIYEPHEIGNDNSGKFPVSHRNHLLAQGRFLKTEDNDKFSTLVSMAEIYNGLNQTRLLCWIKESGLLLVADHLENSTGDSFIWDQLFHGQNILESSQDSFVFRDNTISLKGFPIGENSQIISLKRPAGAKGPEDYAAIRKEGESVVIATILIPFKDSEPIMPETQSGGVLLGENLKFSQNEKSFKLERLNDLIWEI